MSLPLKLELDPVLCAALEEVARRKLLLEHIQAQKEQEREAREFREANSVDGIGELQMRVHATAYHEWNAKQPGCWTDEGFRKWFREKQAPETRIRSHGTKIQVGWTPSTSEDVEISKRHSERRFIKKYE